jgi:hypothetical protein
METPLHKSPITMLAAMLCASLQKFANDIKMASCISLSRCTRQNASLFFLPDPNAAHDVQLSFPLLAQGASRMPRLASLGAIRIKGIGGALFRVAALCLENCIKAANTRVLL